MALQTVNSQAKTIFSHHITGSETDSSPEGKGNTWAVLIWPLNMFTAKDLDS